MKIPRYLLKIPVYVHKYKGGGAFGGGFSTPIKQKTFIDYKHKVITDEHGKEVVVEATAYFRPEVDIPIQSKVEMQDGRTYTVVDRKPYYYNAQVSLIEVALK